MKKDTLVTYVCDLDSFEDVLHSIESTVYYSSETLNVPLSDVLKMEAFTIISSLDVDCYYYHLLFSSYVESSFKVMIRVECKSSHTPLKIVHGFYILLSALNNHSFRYILPSLNFDINCDINYHTNYTPDDIF